MNRSAEVLLSLCVTPPETCETFSSSCQSGGAALIRPLLADVCRDQAAASRFPFADGRLVNSRGGKKKTPERGGRFAAAANRARAPLMLRNKDAARRLHEARLLLSGSTIHAVS